MRTLNINLEIGKWYNVTWQYKGRKYTEYEQYKQYKYGKYYFKDSKGDWSILSLKDIIGIKP